MSGLKSWFDLEPGGVVVRDRGRPTAHRRAGARGRPEADLTACVDCLLCWLYCPDSAVQLDGTAFAGFDLDHLQGLRALRRPSARPARSRWCPMPTDLEARAHLLTGGEAIVEAMRQIDPDVVPVYPITPQTPIIQRLREVRRGRARARRVRQRRVRALGDERRDRRGRCRRADDDRDLVAGPRADGGGRLHRRRDPRARRDGARQPRALRRRSTSTATTPTRCDPRLRRDPALRRERAGGVRPDRARAAARRAPRRPAAGDRLPRRLHRSPTRAEPVELLGRRDGARVRRRLPDPALRSSTSRARRPRGRSRCPTTTSSSAASSGGDRRRAPSSSGSAAEFAELSGRRFGASRRTARRRRARDRLPRLDRRHREDVVDDLRDEGEAVGLLRICSFRPFPGGSSQAPRSSVAERRRARPRRLAGRRRRRSPSRSAAALHGAAVRSHVYGLGGATSTASDIRRVFDGGPRRTVRRTER